MVVKSITGWYDPKSKIKQFEIGGQSADEVAGQDGRFQSVFIGWLYKKQVLLQELLGKSLVSLADDDSKLALAAYEELGDRGLDLLEGQFAIAIWDSQKKQLIVVNDHFGTKPVYYSKDKNGKVLFSSRIGELLSLRKATARPDNQAVFDYLRYGVHDRGERTFFEGVYRLLPGQVLIASKSGLEVKTYSTLQSNLTGTTDDSLVEPENLVKLVEKSVEAHIDDNSSKLSGIGTYLSYSLGSSAIVVLLAKKIKQTSVFSAVFSGPTNNIEDYIDGLSKLCENKLSVHKTDIDSSQFLEDLNDFVKTQEEPVSSVEPYIEYATVREVSQSNKIKILLSGLGLNATSSSKNQRPPRLKYSIEPLLDKNFVEKHEVGQSTGQSGSLETNTYQDRLSQQLRYSSKNTSHFGVEARMPFMDKEIAKYTNDRDREQALKSSLGGLLSEEIINDDNHARIVAFQKAWLLRVKNSVYEVFSSPEFEGRGYFNPSVVKKSFEDFIQHPKRYDTAMFWRLLNVELWLREFVDPPKEPVKEVPVKADYAPNEGKSLSLVSSYDSKAYDRYPIRTDLVDDTTNIVQFIVQYVEKFLVKLPKKHDLKGDTWYLFVSEKIVAISQGRSYFIWDIKARPSARLLSRFVKRTPVGIGLGDPVTMELAMREAGALRIVGAAIAGALGKLVGKKGLFYILAGSDVRAIDGPTEYSVYPSNVSAKLPPKDPDLVAQQISESIRRSKKITKAQKNLFQGTVIIDANDIGRNILGKDIEVTDECLEEIFADNPLGQAKQQTPLAVVVERKK